MMGRLGDNGRYWIHCLCQFQANFCICDWTFKGRPFFLDVLYIWVLPVWEGGLNACPDGLGHLFIATAVILRIFSNRSRCPARPSPRVPGWVRGRGSNRYLGNAQMKQKRVFPKYVIFDILEQKLLFKNIVNFVSLKRFVFGFGGKKVSSSHW